MDAFLADVVAIERQIVTSLVEAGCRYVHIDAPGFTAMSIRPPSTKCARAVKTRCRFHALAPGRVGADCELSRRHLRAFICAAADQRSMWHREGAYDAIAERLFNELPHDRFLLEYDTPRAGSFEPLRFVPKAGWSCSGWSAPKWRSWNPSTRFKRRIEEASKYIPLDQLAISPQCGFASDVVGNLLSLDDQKRKLERVVETARQVWG